MGTCPAVAKGRITYARSACVERNYTCARVGLSHISKTIARGLYDEEDEEACCDVSNPMNMDGSSNVIVIVATTAQGGRGTSGASLCKACPVNASRETSMQSRQLSVAGVCILRPANSLGCAPLSRQLPKPLFASTRIVPSFSKQRCFPLPSPNWRLERKTMRRTKLLHRHTRVAAFQEMVHRLLSVILVNAQVLRGKRLGGLLLFPVRPIWTI